jgi:hypothetical protein
MSSSSIVNVEVVATALQVTPRRIQQFVHEGMPREGSGKYDLVGVRSMVHLVPPGTRAAQAD